MCRCETEEKLRLLKEQEMSQLKLKKKEVEMANTLLEKQLYESQNELQQIMEEHEVETQLFGRMSVSDCG